ncbi:Mysoin-binding motif of peroxisomes-domain-containing protein [Lipomyces orientalis]|uniref:Mysoin-binding motif of peroxisomes-domain-containing protein n=1 Tax=Lipomyces orientalis TaxID=1233043 RepID=A0ACC3TV30_9ASCO
MASEHVVYRNSPLGEYLKASGEDVPTNSEVSEDWDPSAGSATKFTRFAPSVVDHPTVSRTSCPTTAGKAKRKTAIFNGSNTELKPLLLGNESSMKKLRFHFLFAAPLKRRLGPQENSRFLERFRYVLVTSQLLEENVSVAAFGRSEDPGDHFESQFLDSSSKSRKGNRTYLGGGTKHWAGSGGFIVVVAVLFSWFIRGGDRLISGAGTKCKLLIGMVVGLSVSLFFYAHAWRKRLRTTRKTAIDCATRFINNNHLFDINLSRTIGIVQEVEFISRGFGIPGMTTSTLSVPSHVSNSRNSASLSRILKRKSPIGLRRCKKLRSQISSALKLSLSLYRRSMDGLSELCNHSDLEKYFDIYDLNDTNYMHLEEEDQQRNNESDPEILDDDENVADDESECIESLWQLKQQFRRLHHTRRKVLCCLLAMDAQGDRSDVKKWRSVVQEIKTLSDLMKQLSDDLRRSLMQDDINELVEFYAKEQASQHQQQELPQSRYSHRRVPSLPLHIQSKWRPHLQALNTMAATLRNIEAKMFVLREDSARLEQQDLRISESLSNRTPVGGGTRIVDLFLKRSSLGLGVTMDSSASPSKQISSDMLVKQYNSIGTDLRTLIKEWESDREKLYEAMSGTGARAHRASSLDRQYDVDNDSSPVSSAMSSPDSLVSGTTFDSTSTPWSPQANDDGRFIMRDLDDDMNEEGEEDYGSRYLLEENNGSVPMAAKSKMVENIASAMVRQQDRMLRSL